MGRPKNDGRGRLGGRKKGTKNKPKDTIGEWVENLVNRNRAQFEADLLEMKPAERAGVFAALLSVCVNPVRGKNSKEDEAEACGQIAEVVAGAAGGR